ncbi:MAG: DNA primase [candidate division Zixibacteria bacterium RBG_16_50_21]|nr:MAG: DNA primase [candidate division Zixibacteria bacterium RBG_16_50_21]
MSNYFPQELIDQIRQANDVVEIVSEYVSLKKKGRNYFGLCPFHAEKTPSFSVNPEKQIFHCFGCGQGGNIVTFLMSHEKLGFVEAIRFLAKRANIRLPQKETNRQEMELNDKLLLVHQLASSYYTSNLENNIKGKMGQDYLGSRKLSDQTISEFRLGLALDEWDGLHKSANAKGVETPTLLEAGLIIARNDGKGYYDRFKNRLIFPIFNLSGKTVAFAGRILDEKDSPKYMNSPESPIYQKGKLLYGLNFSKEEIREEKFAIVVEGYMDYLSLYQSGIRNLVASCGTAFTSDQARLLARFAEEVVLLFDSDTAGQNAVLRSVDLLYDAGLDVKVGVLPAGYDPDKYVNEFGAGQLGKLIKESNSYIKFKISLLKGKFSKLSLREQEQVLVSFAQTAAKIGHEVRKDLYLKQVSEELGIGEATLRKALKSVSPRTGESKPARETTGAKLTEEVWEREFLAFMIDNPTWFKEAVPQISLEDFSIPTHEQLWRLLQDENQLGDELDIADLLEATQNQDLRQLLLELANFDYPRQETSTTFPDYIQKFNDYIQKFKARRIEGPVRKVKQALKEAEREKNGKRAQALMKELQDMQNILKDSRLTGKPIE